MMLKWVENFWYVWRRFVGVEKMEKEDYEGNQLMQVHLEDGR